MNIFKRGRKSGRPSILERAARDGTETDLDTTEDIATIDTFGDRAVGSLTLPRRKSSPPSGERPEVNGFDPAHLADADVRLAVKNEPAEESEGGESAFLTHFGLNSQEPTDSDSLLRGDPHRRMDEPLDNDDVPGFTGSLSGIFSAEDTYPSAEAANLRAKLRQAFTPTRPKVWAKDFAGRYRAVKRIVEAIEQEQAHVIIHGVRGIGKSSLANIIEESARQAEYQVRRFPCSSDTTYEEMFRRLLSSLPASFLDRSARASNPNVERFDQLLPQGAFGPTDVTQILSFVALEHVIFIFDEFDRVQDAEIKNQIAETIKNLSDISARVTFLIVGIAENLEELIGKHPSVHRHLVGIHLPLMEPEEVRSLVLRGARNAGIRFDDAVTDLVVSFSKGLPYYAQLICLHAGRRAIERGSTLVCLDDLRAGLGSLLEDADPSAAVSYKIATRGGRNVFIKDLLYAAAVAKFDRFGAVTGNSVAKALRAHFGRDVRELHLHNAFNKLTLAKNGAIVAKSKTPDGTIQYKFNNQSMRQYILLKQARVRNLL